MSESKRAERCDHWYGHAQMAARCNQPAGHDGMHMAVGNGIEWRTGLSGDIADHVGDPRSAAPAPEGEEALLDRIRRDYAALEGSAWFKEVYVGKSLGEVIAPAPETEREPDGWTTAGEVADLAPDDPSGEAIVFRDPADARYNHDLTATGPVGDLIPVYFNRPPPESEAVKALTPDAMEGALALRMYVSGLDRRGVPDDEVLSLGRWASEFVPHEFVADIAVPASHLRALAASLPDPDAIIARRALSPEQEGES